MTIMTPTDISEDTLWVKIGMCQVHTVEWDMDGNGQRTLDALNEAAEQGAQLAITPECVFNGYCFDFEPDFPERLAALAMTVEDPWMMRVRELARARKMEVVVGFVERGEGNKIHNACALISREGEHLRTYRKVHCRDFESTFYDGVFTPGEEFSTDPLEYDGKYMHLGMMICFDREIPETVRSIRATGAELIACPLATNTSDLLAPPQLNEQMNNEIITRARAAENEVYIVVVNHAGRYNGGSFIVGPGGQAVHQMGSEPGVDVIDVPVGIVKEKFHDFPEGWMGWGFRRPGIYAKYMNA